MLDLLEDREAWLNTTRDELRAQVDGPPAGLAARLTTLMQQLQSPATSWPDVQRTGLEGLTVPTVRTLRDRIRNGEDVETDLATLSATAEEIEALTWEGAKKFDGKTALYVKPMYWAEHGAAGVVAIDPESTRFALCLFEAPMGNGHGGSSLTLSPFRRPTLESMPTDAKAGCLYPNNARILTEARSRGFDNALVRDMLGNIAETGSSNVFLVKDGVVFTPAANRTFLAGITRFRVMTLLREAGFDVVEATLTMADFEAADEIFTSGNYSKVLPVTRLESRDLQAGPVAAKARDLYMDWAHAARDV